MTQSGYPEAQLEIVKYFPAARKFLVACARCDIKQEIIEDRILEPLKCGQCDINQPQPQPAQKNIKIKLVPAQIQLPGGVQLFVYLPVQETPDGCPNCE